MTVAGSRVLWAYVEDLFFRAKVEGLARPFGHAVEFHKTPHALVEALGVASARPAVVLVELGTRPEAGLALLASLAALPGAPPTLAFYSHVEDELRRQALAAGATKVVPRSAFVKRFGDLVEELVAGKSAN
jgi:DNA-binding NarL/FixJ family response regulator